MQNNLGFNASLQVAGKNYSYAITAFKKKKKNNFWHFTVGWLCPIIKGKHKPVIS